MIAAIIAPASPAVFVFIMVRATASAFSFEAIEPTEPPLKPNHPIHNTSAPSVTRGIFEAGIFAKDVSLGDQIKGVVVVALFAFVVSYVTIYAINKVFKFRASDEEQMEGIDISECGIEAYPEFKRAF